MRVKLISFRYSTTLGGFDDTALSAFIRDKEVIAFREHFYTVNDVPHLSCVVHYQDAVVPLDVRRAPPEPAAPPATAALRPTRGAPSSRDEVPDAAADLDTNQRALFNHLREWRTQVAREEGLPPYVLFTNRQLAAIVRARPDSPTALGTVEGVGNGKVTRYGRGLLTALHGAPRGETPPDPGEPLGETATATETETTVAPSSEPQVTLDAPSSAGGAA